LRQWIDAPDINPDDLSYWVAPSDDDPPLGINSESFEVALAFNVEKRMGCPSGPMFVPEWDSGRDPRFHDSSNPLYDALAKKDSDWRYNIDELKFGEFLKYCRELKVDGATHVREGKSDAACLRKPQPAERKTMVQKSDSPSKSNAHVKVGRSHAQTQADLVLGEQVKLISMLKPSDPRLLLMVERVATLAKCDGEHPCAHQSQCAKRNEEIAKNSSVSTVAADAINAKSKDKFSKPVKSTQVTSKVNDKSVNYVTVIGSASSVCGHSNGIGNLKAGVNASGKLKEDLSMLKDCLKSDVKSCKTTSIKDDVIDKSQINVVATVEDSLKTVDINDIADLKVVDSKVKVDAKVKVNKERKQVDKKKGVLASSVENGDATIKCRCCAGCSKLESRPHEFKKCKRY